MCFVWNQPHLSVVISYLKVYKPSVWGCVCILKYVILLQEIIVGIGEDQHFTSVDWGDTCRGGAILGTGWSFTSLKCSWWVNLCIRAKGQNHRVDRTTCVLCWLVLGRIANVLYNQILNRIQVGRSGEISPRESKCCGQSWKVWFDHLGPEVPISKMKGYILRAVSTLPECMGDAPW